MSAGIDYSSGCTNIDTVNGIRYGVISQHDVLQVWCDEAQPCYGDMTEDEIEFSDPVSYVVDDGAYRMESCLDSDIMVLSSPYYTFAQFCSPCVPGAGNLNNATPDGVKTYCLGHDWFEGCCAPYPVYSVETGKEIKA